jgi:3-methyladenine DNA glycosylase AlkD
MSSNPESVALTESSDVLAKAFAEIRAFCVQHADPAIVAKYSRYFTEGYDGYGISKETWEVNRLLFYDRYREPLGVGGFFDLGDRLLSTGKFEEGSFAIACVTPYRSTFTRADMQQIGNWLAHGVRNWAHVDGICSELLAPTLREGRVSLEEISAWRASPVRWKRRAVPVAMLGLLKGIPDVEPLLDFLRPMMSDQERVVHQGLGWFLREAWKRQPGAVERFLTEWKESAARLIYQYATEKMTPEQKARFRRSKTSKS